MLIFRTVIKEKAFENQAGLEPAPAVSGNNLPHAGAGSKPARLRLISLLLLVLMITLSGCGKNQKSEALAKIGGKEISQEQFEAYLDFKRLQPTNEGQREKLLEQYLERETLSIAIEKEPLLDKRLIEAELNEFKKEMLISRYFEKFLKDTVSDQAVKNYYTTHAAEYEKKQVRVAHILIRTNGKMTETERSAKLTIAQDAYAQVYGGKPFEEVAAAYSEDKNTAQKGGEIGWVSEGTIDPKFSEKAFAAKPGEATEPFETAFGYHVIKVLEGPSVVKSSFEKVSGDIRYQLRNKAKEAETQRLMAILNPEKKQGKK